MLDAQYFLTHGGERGPQTTVLTPGNYRLNTYLWDVDIKDAVDIPKGSVGVIKSNVVTAVDFGSMVAQKPNSNACQQKRVSTSSNGAVAADQNKEDQGVLTAVLVPVGCIGIWEQALQPGRYYVNEAAFKVTMISTRVQTWEFKGGYKKRYIDLSLDQAGNLTQSQRSQDIPVAEGAADPAVTPFVEGWLVPLELRVLAQVTPDNAPFVVAAVGGLPEIENNIMVPTIRSIVRNVVGATGRHVLDLADNRAELEHAVEDAIRPEGLRAGIIIKEVKFGDVALPPELLVSRLRQQLADQLQVTYQQEQKAQTQRIQTEKAHATAEQQHQLVEALIGVQVAEQNRNAAKLRGEGQKLELEETAQGQKAQADVLGAGPGADDQPCSAIPESDRTKAGDRVAGRAAGAADGGLDQRPGNRARQRRRDLRGNAQQWRRRRRPGLGRVVDQEMNWCEQREEQWPIRSSTALPEAPMCGARGWRSPKRA